MSLFESSDNGVFWNVSIGASIVMAVCITIISLKNGIYEVYPFLYFLPIILFVYRYPQRGVIFSLLISIVYLGLVYLITSFHPLMVAISTAWFVIFVTIGVVTSSFAERMQAEERKYRGIFENSQAGILTFDLTTKKILELNGKCARLLNYAPMDLVDRDISRIIPDNRQRDEFIADVRASVQAGDRELQLMTSDGSVRQFQVSASLTPNDVVICSILDITERKLAEKVVQKARDELEDRVKERTEELLQANQVLKAEIRERKRFEAAIRLTNRKLQTLSSITRHDILNQVTAIVMYVSMADENSTDPVVREQLQKIEEITRLIQKQIRFTRDYQSIGASAPSWQDLAGVVSEAAKDVNLGDVRLETVLDHAEVYADLLLVKVFSNLIDNSLRHGERTRTIRVTFRKEDDALVIVYEDDGVGVPEGAKEKIFRREYYRNTGYGMFLTQEILNITGATIRETGVAGRGARFEILIPKGMFRIAGDSKGTGSG